MYKIFKISLNEHDVEVVNGIDCDGVEIQLLNRENDFDLLEKIDKKIVSLHYDLYTCPEKRERLADDKDVEVDLYTQVTRITDWPYFQKVVEEAYKYNAGIVLHMHYNPVKMADYNEFVERLRRVKGEYPELELYIENAGLMPHHKKLNNCYVTAYELPDICKKINEDVGIGKVLYPLLDICHEMIEFASAVDYSRDYSYRELIERYKSEKQLFHFNYAIGDGFGNEHSNNFDTNQKLLINLLLCIKEINPEAYLVLEVLEDDYSDRVNEKKLLNDIKFYEKNL